MDIQLPMGRALSGHVVAAVTVIAAGVAMGVGYASVVHPLAGLGIVVVLLGGAVVWVRPLWGLALMVALIPIEGSVMLGSGASLIRLLGIGVAAAWFLRKLIRGEPWDRVLTTPVLAILAVFLSYVALSSLWAVLRIPFFSEMFRLGMFVALPVLIVDLVRSRDDAALLVKAAVAGGMVAAGMTLSQSFGTTYVRRAGEGVTGGLNRTALTLTCIVPLAFYLLRSTRPPWSLLGLAYVVSAPIAVAGTLSRMSLLVLTAILTVELFHSLVRGRGRGMVLLVGLAAIAMSVFVLPVQRLTPRLVERIETIGPYIEATLNRDEGGIVASSGRGFHIRVAIAIFRDHPWFGAGYENYRLLFVRRYQAELWGSDGHLFRNPRSPHGTLWGFLADLGIVGTAIWLSMIGAMLVALLRSLGSRADGDLGDRALGRSVLLFLLLLCGYHLSADVHLNKILWLAFGLALALPKVFQDDGPSLDHPEQPPNAGMSLPAQKDRPVATLGQSA